MAADYDGVPVVAQQGPQGLYRTTTTLSLGTVIKSSIRRWSAMTLEAFFAIVTR